MKKTTNIIVIILLALAAILPARTDAIGQISKPIVIKDALRGQDYQEEMVIFNTEKRKLKIGLSAEGDIKDWVEFYNLSDQENPITEIEMEPGSNLKVNAVIKISDSAPNGEYKGSLSATSKPDDVPSSDESQVMLSQKIDRPVSITVSDNQIIKFDASVIPNSYDLAKDEPLSIRVIYDNQGNIDISPQIQVKIKKDGEENIAIYNVIYPYPENTKAVIPNSRQENDLFIIQTTGLAKGKYLAEFDFLINNEVKLHKQFAFSSGVYKNGVKVLGIFKSFNDNNFFNLPVLIGLAIVAGIAALLSTRKYFKVKVKK